jgi:hypothetical protein
MSHLLYDLLSIFENPSGLKRPLARDISSNQGKYNMDVAKANGVLLITMRAAIGWSYQDKFFPGYWEDAEGIYRNSYHIIHPDLDVIRQADNWYRVNPEIEVIPRTIDLEINKLNLPATQVADTVWKMSEIVKSRDGVRPIIYSRYLLINLWLASWTSEMLNDHYWWLAQYLWDRRREHPGPPTLPDRVRKDRVILHQTADKKPGFYGEAESAAVDYDRWELGSAVDMVAFIEEVWGGHAPPPPVNEYNAGWNASKQDTINKAEASKL